MSENARARIVITGRVQMVGFRWFARRWAEDLDLTGWVRNNRDGSVGLEVEGKRQRIETLIKELKDGPKHARVENVDASWLAFENRFRAFQIRY